MEKTFSELIEETPLHELLSEPEKDMVKELLRQVREATIAECFNKPSFNSYTGYIIMEKYKNWNPAIEHKNKKVYENLTSANEAMEQYKKDINNKDYTYEIFPIALIRDLPTDRIRIEP